jgi:hypothetical protein
MDWTQSELERRWLAEDGQAVVANRHTGVDPNLIAWAKRTGRFVDIGRPGPWGNPFSVGVHGTRAEVIAKHRAWLIDHPEMLAEVPGLKVLALDWFRGRVLACWCHPEPCHGHTLAELANQGAVGVIRRHSA